MRTQGVAEKLARSLLAAMERALEAEAVSRSGGFLQGLDPRIKLAALLLLIVSAVLAKTLSALAAMFALAVLLALSSRISIARLGKQVWAGVLLFTGVIALPALVLVPGDALWQVPLLRWTVTEQGLRSAAFLLGRAETCATLALLLVMTTPWMHVLKALRSLGAPMVLVAILGMTHRYIFVLSQTALQMFEARQSRIVAPMGGPQQRRLAAAAAGVLLDKAFQLSSDVHLAMVSRGYRGEVFMLDEFRARRRDWGVLLLALSLFGAMLWWQK